MTALEKLEFLVNVRLAKGDNYHQAIIYRATQLDIGWQSLVTILEGNKLIKTWLKKEIDELYEMHERAQVIAARFNHPEEISELVH